eukprot:1816000-Lingulodinium_polyedra.AAC.1
MEHASALAEHFNGSFDDDRSGNGHEMVDQSRRHVFQLHVQDMPATRATHADLEECEHPEPGDLPKEVGNP